MKEEIINPVRVGRAFDQLGEVPELLREMRTTLRAAPPDFAAWREPRRMEKIAPLFTAFLEKRGVEPTRSGPRSS
jgi:hypothetical protein